MQKTVDSAWSICDVVRWAEVQERDAGFAKGMESGRWLLRLHQRSIPSSLEPTKDKKGPLQRTDINIRDTSNG